MYVGEGDGGWDVRMSWRGALVPAAGAAVLGVVLWRLGTAPFLRGLRAVDARTVAGELRLRVADDGHGGADERSGSGLTGIRRRVEALADETVAQIRRSLG